VRWTCWGSRRMLPGRTGGAHAVQGRRRAVGAGPVLGASSRWGLRVGRTAPVGPTHAVDSTTGAVACGSQVHGLDVLDHDWEAAFFAEKCPWLFRRRRRPRQGMTSSSAGERPRRADLPTQRHRVRSRTRSSHTSSIRRRSSHRLRTPGASVSASVGGWAGGRDRDQAPTPGSRRR
jgi:hypothetical protein